MRTRRSGAVRLFFTLSHMALATFFVTTSKDLRTSALKPVIDSSLNISEEFELWMNAYGKTYENQEEKQLRKNNFIQNRAFVINHNANRVNGIHNFDIDLTSYADMTNGEFRNATSDIFYYYYEGIFFKQYIKHQNVLTWISATVTGSMVAGADPVSIVFEMSNEMIIGENNTLIIAASRPIWTGVAPAISCTGTLASVAHNDFTASTISNTTLKVQPHTGFTIGKGNFKLTCTSNLLVNGPEGDVKFDIISNSHIDAMPLSSQVGYTITGSSLTWHYALPSVSKKTGELPGNIDFRFGITTGLEASDTITIVSNRPIWEDGRGFIQFEIQIPNSLTQGDVIEIHSGNNIWDCIDPNTCPNINVQGACTGKIDSVNIASNNFEIDFKDWNLLHFKVGATGIPAGLLELTCNNLAEIGSLGTITHNIVSYTPGSIKFTIEITDTVLDTHSLLIVSNKEIWESANTVTSCSATENGGTTTNAFVAKTHVEEKNVLVITASGGNIASGTFHLDCTDNIKAVESYSAYGPLKFHVLWNPDKTCDSDWLLGPNGRCYKFDSTPRSQSNAETSCIGLNGHLASIHSLEEHDFIYENVLSGVGNAWIGINSDKKSWTDNSPWNYVNWALHFNEPDNVGGNENCGAIRKAQNTDKDNAWLTLACNEAIASVCMKQSVEFTASSVMSSLESIVSYSAKRGAPTSCSDGSNSFYTRALSRRALVLTATGAIPAGSFDLNCTDNIAKNGETGLVAFFIGSTKDTVPLREQVGYTIT